MECDVPLIGASLSSTFSAAYGANTLIDGSLATVSATNLGVNNWASVRVAAGTPIAYVAVYNRVDSAAYQEWLSPFEVWVGGYYGDVSSASAYRCAEMVVPTGAGPFMAPCYSVSTRAYVTVRQVGAARYLTIAEVKLCSEEMWLCDKGVEGGRGIEKLELLIIRERGLV